MSYLRMKTSTVQKQCILSALLHDAHRQKTQQYENHRKYTIIRAFGIHMVLRFILPLHIRSKLFLQALKNISSLHVLTPFSTNANSVSQRSSVKASKISPRRTTGIVGVHISCRQVSMQNVT